jgi:8-oxo-dGTP diphosphatase
VSGLSLRDAVRAVVLDPDDRVLLVRFEFPHAVLWAPPGGGVDAGESDEEALRRELREELGLVRFELGPCVWVREHVFDPKFGELDGQIERVYLVRTPAFEPRPHLTREQLEAEYVFGLRWWAPDELARSDERFAPAGLQRLVADLVAGGAPPEPLVIGP